MVAEIFPIKMISDKNNLLMDRGGGPGRICGYTGGYDAQPRDPYKIIESKVTLNFYFALVDQLIR